MSYNTEARLSQYQRDYSALAEKINQDNIRLVALESQMRHLSVQLSLDKSLANQYRAVTNEYNALCNQIRHDSVRLQNLYAKVQQEANRYAMQQQREVLKQQRVMFQRGDYRKW